MQLTSMAVGNDTSIKATPTIVRKVILTPVGAISTLTVKDNTTTILVLQAAANGNSVVADFPDGLTCATSLVATLTGASATAYFGY